MVAIWFIEIISHRDCPYQAGLFDGSAMMNARVKNFWPVRSSQWVIWKRSPNRHTYRAQKFGRPSGVGNQAVVSHDAIIIKMESDFRIETPKNVFRNVMAPHGAGNHSFFAN